MIHGHGDDRHLFPLIRINFSSNVNPYGLNEGLQSHLNRCIGKLTTYPDPMAESLAKTIEMQKGLPAGSVLMTNGAVEAFYLLAALYQNKRSLIYTPSFSEYEDACRMYHHSLTFCPNTLFPNEDTAKYDTIWIGNPNNPDGKLFNRQALKDMICAHPDTLFIVDEAYVQFSLSPITLENEAPECANLVVIRSLTKRFSIPGLRLGYLITTPGMVNRLKRLLMPWRINSLAIEAGEYCFSSRFSDNFSLSYLLDESRRLQSEINSLDGFSVIPSATSYFLVTAPTNAPELKRWLAENFNILIRDASNFRGLSKNHFRLSTQLPEKNNVLIKALHAWR
ncbi:aminotransferase class I/II-fold pyridoxal phosphate-dependent enzyme [Geofilum sp. OHC36d9]|uniref:aminotransferase class I/II-fold pyridoxal phosphate-dependent enzyme n=1 Tax=Geofilum sp. OHC36d9 TaxID=3458413 RepID=UPI004034C6E9